MIDPEASSILSLETLVMRVKQIKILRKSCDVFSVFIDSQLFANPVDDSVPNYPDNFDGKVILNCQVNEL